MSHEPWIMNHETWIGGDVPKSAPPALLFVPTAELLVQSLAVAAR
jgi:hypothetical protein